MYKYFDDGRDCYCITGIALGVMIHHPPLCLPPGTCTILCAYNTCTWLKWGTAPCARRQLYYYSHAMSCYVTYYPGAHFWSNSECHTTSKYISQRCVWASPPPQGGFPPFQKFVKNNENIISSVHTQHAVLMLQLLYLAVLQDGCGTPATNFSQNAWI